MDAASLAAAQREAPAKRARLRADPAQSKAKAHDATHSGGAAERDRPAQKQRRVVGAAAPENELGARKRAFSERA
jgi:hypothetical protein